MQEHLSGSYLGYGLNAMNASGGMVYFRRKPSAASYAQKSASLTIATTSASIALASAAPRAAIRYAQVRAQSAKAGSIILKNSRSTSSSHKTMPGSAATRLRAGSVLLTQALRASSGSSVPS